jgi:hypothetical protein
VVAPYSCARNYFNRSFARYLASLASGSGAAACAAALGGQWFRADAWSSGVILSPFSPLQRSASRVNKALRDVFFVVAALTLLGAQALSTLHYVLVPHHLCAVHGVLEDGHASVGDAEHAAPADPVSVDADDEEVHDACSVATKQDDGVLLERPVLATAQLLEASAPPASVGVSVKLERAALLSTAPKTSPPVRA